MYDFRWSDPLSWIAIGIPVVFFFAVCVGIWEAIKWILA